MILQISELGMQFVEKKLSTLETRFHTWDHLSGRKQKCEKRRKFCRLTSAPSVSVAEVGSSTTKDGWEDFSGLSFGSPG